MTRYRVSGMAAATNITENVIKQLTKKLRLIEGFATMASAESFSRLLVGCYRFKRFTDSYRHDDNGRSPLELAGAQPSPRRLAPLPAYPTEPSTLDVTPLRFLCAAPRLWWRSGSNRGPRWTPSARTWRGRMP